LFVHTACHFTQSVTSYSLSLDCREGEVLFVLSEETRKGKRRERRGTKEGKKEREMKEKRWERE